MCNSIHYSIKKQKKGKYVLLATAYRSVYDCNMEFLNDKEKEYIQLHEGLQSNLYNTKKDLLELVKKYEIDVIRINAKINIFKEKYQEYNFL